MSRDDEDDDDDEEKEDDEDDDEEEEDESLTLQDVKDVADTVKSIAEAGKAIKEFTTPRPPMGNLGSTGPPSDKEIEDAIKEAKEKAKPRAWIRSSIKSPPQTTAKPGTKKSKHHWTRGEKIGIASLIVGIIGLIIYLL